MENNDDYLRRQLATCKVWSELLSMNDSAAAEVAKSPSPTAEDECYLDLDNYVSRLDSLVLSNSNSVKHESEKSLEKLLNNCFQVIKKTSKLDEYSTSKVKLKPSFQADCSSSSRNTSKCPIEIIEIMDISNENNQVIIEKKQPPGDVREMTEQPVETNHNPQTSIVAASDNKPNESQSNLSELTALFKEALEQGNSERLKSHLTDLSANYNADFLRQFCANLIDIENHKGVLRSSVDIKEASLKEHHLSLVVNCLLAFDSPQLTYNVSYIYIKFIVCEYVRLKMKLQQDGELFSRELTNMCGQLLPAYQRQFLSSCLVEWSAELNSNSTNLNGRQLLEFLVNIVKDYFTEIDSSLMLQCLIDQQTMFGEHWHEPLYSLVTCVLEKLTSNVTYENLSSLINKMHKDSIDLCKSVVFTRCLALLLNKNKIFFITNQSQQQPISEMKVTRTLENETLLNLIDSIIENNKTINKRMLATLVKTFKK
jgi:hypothetical protein